MSPVWVRPSSLGLGQAEVGDPDDPCGVQQQVRRLDVAVDDPPGMGVGQPRRRLPADLRHAAEERPPARTRPPRAGDPPGSTTDEGGLDTAAGAGSLAGRGLGLIRIEAIAQGGCRPRRVARRRPRLLLAPPGVSGTNRPVSSDWAIRLTGRDRDGAGRRRPGRDRRVRRFGFPWPDRSDARDPRAAAARR